MNKKIYLLGLCVAASATVANAQQLPNVGFEQWKAGDDMGATKYMGMTNATNPRPYDTKTGVTEPSGWNGSNVEQAGQKGYFIEKETVSDGNIAVRLVNKFVGLNLGFTKIGDEAPGFITFGTPWVYAEIRDMNNCDGGAFGGVEFSYKPDAIKGRYKYTQGDAPETSHIIAYLWNGTFVSQIGSVDDTQKESCNDVDRAIINNTPGDGDGKLVASCDYEITTTNGDWMDIVVPLEYKEGAGEPTKMNVIISAADYWTRSNIKENTILAADDVDFVYYSTLTALEVNGESVALEDGKYEYAMSGTELPTADQIKATTKSQFAEAAVTVDSENAQVRIVVTNQGGKDTDGETSHTYTLQYEQPAAGVEYEGYLNVSCDDLGGVLVEDKKDKIIITETGEGLCSFALLNLTLNIGGSDKTLGDIVVDNVEVTEAEGVKSYNGAGDLTLVVGPVHVDLNGEIDANNSCDFTINVTWNSLPIVVTFTSEEKTSGVEGISGESVAVYGMAGAVAVSGYNGAVDVYSVDGRLVESVLVDGNAEIALDGGLYIVRAGGEAYKVFVK